MQVSEKFKWVCITIMVVVLGGGFWLTMALIPVSWQSVLAGFLLFRLFDIWKPFPIRLLDKHIKGGFGIMIDDVAAAFYAWFSLIFWYRVIPLL